MVLSLLWFISKIADYLISYYLAFYSKYGLEGEMNPIGKYMLQYPLLFLVYIVLSTYFVYKIQNYNKVIRFTLVFLILLSVAVIINNLTLL